MISVERLFYVLLLLIFASCESNHGSHHKPNRKKDFHWDYLVFTQQWPPTTCKFPSHSHHCVIPKGVKGWSVHGLWPDKIGTKGPNYCNDTWHFKEATIKPLEPKMFVHWANLFADTPASDLWSHEWVKHGTCAASDLKLRGEYNYFSTALKLNAVYSLSDLLAKSNIVASNTKGYKPSAFEGALSQALHNKKITLQCLFHFKYSASINEVSHGQIPFNDLESYIKKKVKSKQQFIYQVEICLDRKTLLPIDCPSLGNCNENQEIFYPEMYHSLD